LNFLQQHFLERNLAGNGWVALVYAICLLINISVEEIAWWGYLLPCQQIAYGRWEWVLNGVLWILILHIAIRWMYGGLLATGFITLFVAQRAGNTWMAVLIHGTGNFIFLLLILCCLAG